MRTGGLFLLWGAGLLLLAATLAPSSTAIAARACARTSFKTVLVKEACANGGQAQAKAVMKDWSRKQKVKSCNHCHSNLAPSYELTADGLHRFTKLGGK